VLKQLNVEVVGFERIKEEYMACPDFGEIFGALSLAEEYKRVQFFSVYTLKQGVTQEIDGFLL